jgi:multiple sugar transport system permease protein
VSADTSTASLGKITQASRHGPGKRSQPIKWVFILPAIVWVLTFTLFPFGYAIYTSFQSYRYGQRVGFVGLDNYRRLFSDDVLWQDLITTLTIVSIAVTVEMLLGICLAILFNREIRGRSLLRTIVTLPLFATPIAIGYLGITLFYEEGGPVNSLITAVGGPQIAWLSSPNGAKAAIIITDIWQWTPFIFLVILAALQSLPQDVIEASAVDGSSELQSFWNITLPLLTPMLWLVLLLRAIDAFKIFDIVAAMTLGGPGRATEVYSRYVYLTARRFTNYGDAAAQGFLLLFIVMFMVTLLWSRIRHLYDDTPR